MSLAANIRRIRRERGLTQREVAYIAGMSVSAYRNLEAGRVAKPKPEVLRRLAKGFGVKLRDLLERDLFEGPSKPTCCDHVCGGVPQRHEEPEAPPPPWAYACYGVNEEGY